jgi:hypothetical protein
MSSEADLSQEKKWHYEQLAKKCIAGLAKYNISATLASDRDEARAQVLSMIPEGATVGIGDSVTLLECGIIQEVEESGRYQVLNPFHTAEGTIFYPQGLEAIEVMRKALTCDVFITGTNAVTLDGKLVNIDGFGNRVAALIFGPRKRIVVVGANKIVANLDEALRRIKDIAAPLNAKRHGLKHGREEPPCATTGTCSDCRTDQRICLYTTIIEFQRKPPPGREPRLNVVLVAEELGI